MFLKVLLIACTLSVLACNKDDDRPEAFQTSWIVGGDHTSDTTVIVPSPQGAASLEISDYSVCPDHQVTVVVTTGEDTEVIKFQADSARIETFEVHTLADLSIRTHLTPTFRDIVCIWLGEARITYKTVE